ncbi:MAG: hypothetical protein NTX82_05315, partial [Candidatus Parcubacteria bacterium]|nr:hypothetical protein [Candidatus Parcubacteria bacterium]
FSFPISEKSYRATSTLLLINHFCLLSPFDSILMNDQVVTYSIANFCQIKMWIKAALAPLCQNRNILI